MLLLGEPGRGKSTLAAALVARGLSYIADDTVLLTSNPIRVRGVPSRMGIKEGSWSVLQHYWPNLEDLPIHVRADGKRIRYLLPENALINRPGFAELTASSLIFPRYEPNANTTVRNLSRAEALLKITEAGYDIPGQITEQVIAALIEWLDTVERIELCYGDLDDALEKLLRAQA